MPLRDGRTVIIGSSVIMDVFSLFEINPVVIVGEAFLLRHLFKSDLHVVSRVGYIPRSAWCTIGIAASVVVQNSSRNLADNIVPALFVLALTNAPLEIRLVALSPLGDGCTVFINMTV